MNCYQWKAENVLAKVKTDQNEYLLVFGNMIVTHSDIYAQSFRQFECIRFVNSVHKRNFTFWVWHIVHCKWHSIHRTYYKLEKISLPIKSYRRQWILIIIIYSETISHFHCHLMRGGNWLLCKIINNIRFHLTSTYTSICRFGPS